MKSGIVLILTLPTQTLFLMTDYHFFLKTLKIGITVYKALCWQLAYLNESLYPT